MFYIIKNLNYFLNKKMKINLILFLFFSFISSIIETLSIGIIPIFISIYLKTGVFYEMLTGNLIQLINSLSALAFLTFSSITIILIFIIKNLILYLIQRFYLTNHNIITSSITSRVYKSFIDEEFVAFKKYSLGEKLRDLTTEANNSTAAIMLLFGLAQEFLTLIFIIFLLLFSSTNATLILIFSLFLISITFLKLYGEKLKKLGLSLLDSRKNLYKLIYQTSNLIREIKINSKEDYFLNTFKLEHKKLIERMKEKILITALPKYFIEIGAVIFIFGIMFYEIEISKSTIKDILPGLTLVIISALRVIPTINGSIQKLSNLKTFKVSYELILNILKKNYNKKNIPKTSFHSTKDFKSPILEIKNFSFKYENQTIFKNQNFKIEKNTPIGIFGTSGVGKSTLIDILTGVVDIEKGDIFFEGSKINSIKEIDFKISLVSQNPQLLNTSIKNNIALGVEEKDIDIEKLLGIIKKTNLNKLVESKKDGIEFLIGDNAGNLSGGQIQRLAIARSLYFDPKIIFLDEPTSALDKENEGMIYDLIYNTLSVDTSVVIVSHRKDFLNRCKYIYEVDNNKINLI